MDSKNSFTWSISSLQCDKKEAESYLRRYQLRTKGKSYGTKKNRIRT
jgi:hypothetical protein